MNQSKAALMALPVMQSKFLAEVIDRACNSGADRNQILKGCLLRPEVLDEPSQPIPGAYIWHRHGPLFCPAILIYAQKSRGNMIGVQVSYLRSP